MGAFSIRQDRQARADVKWKTTVNLLREPSVLDRRWGRTVDAAELPEYPALVDFRTPEEEVDRDARMARITGLIEALPPKLQAVLILQYRDGLTYEEIAVPWCQYARREEIRDARSRALPQAPDAI